MFVVERGILRKYVQRLCAIIVMIRVIFIEIVRNMSVDSVEVLVIQKINVVTKSLTALGVPLQREKSEHTLEN